jgi:hypothetical protein
MTRGFWIACGVLLIAYAAWRGYDEQAIYPWLLVGLFGFLWVYRATMISPGAEPAIQAPRATHPDRPSRQGSAIFISLGLIVLGFQAYQRHGRPSDGLAAVFGFLATGWIAGAVRRSKR